jgi:hypothetical protein
MWKLSTFAGDVHPAVGEGEAVNSASPWGTAV